MLLSRIKLEDEDGSWIGLELSYDVLQFTLRIYFHDDEESVLVKTATDLAEYESTLEFLAEELEFPEAAVLVALNWRQACLPENYTDDDPEMLTLKIIR